MKVVTLIQRKPGTTRAAFKDYYEKNHAPLGTRYFPFDKYVRNHLDSSEPADVPFDVYMEAYLDRTKALGLLTGDVAKVFDDDEKRFMNAPPRPEGFDAEERLVSGPPRGVDPRGAPKTAFFVSNTGGAAPKAFFDAAAAWGKALGEEVNAIRVTMDEVIPGHSVTFFHSDAVLVLWTGHTFTAMPKAPAGLKIDAMLALDSQETSKEDLAASSGNGNEATRMIELVIDQRRKDLGGFEVGRVLPFAKRRMVGPFVFFDHMGPVDFPAGIGRNFDVRPHPHIGLSTVTYLFDGEIIHRDSVGSEQAIQPGAVNWMTAGRGITHSERFEKARRQGDTMHGIQAWVALPEADEEIEPSFAHHGPEDLPTYEGDGLWARLIAGKAFHAEAKVKTHSPLFYVHWNLRAGAQAQLEPEYPERAAYIALGSVDVGGRTYHAGQMLVFTAGVPVLFTATTAATVMLLGGEPLGERFIEWNFVSSRKERIEQAKADWRAGRMKLPDLDHDEFIPLPGDPPPAGPVS